MSPFAPVNAYTAIACAALLAVATLLPGKLDDRWAGLCLRGAVYFIFRA